jgi:uncharacterized protein YerC
MRLATRDANRIKEVDYEKKRTSTEIAKHVGISPATYERVKRIVSMIRCYNLF